MTVFRNRIDDFIFRNPLTDEEFEAREAEFDERFGVEHEDEGEGHGHEGEFPFVEFNGTDATLWGVEAHADVTLTERLGAEFDLRLRARRARAPTAQPLPRIPPQRLMAGLRYTQGRLQVGGNVTAVARQDRVFGAETETAAYGLLRALRHLHAAVDARASRP